jgi:hypothetical protein
MQSAGLSIIRHMAAVRDQRGRHAMPSIDSTMRGGNKWINE